ncbi:hypothetical protein FB45DRAFT_1063597 [Roridomyces roridus]|uniref:Apple domain-containing protein n=1 Tax=Roridomyces roridus TaxID=1738132 RepID=A0AAD7FFG3_9AGAR|nr:hypothetical protein FB45DRAFT_1063597 [Roridomyces roridus]
MKLQLLSSMLLLALSAIASPVDSVGELVAVPFAPGSSAVSPILESGSVRSGEFTFIEAGTTTSKNTGLRALEARQFSAPGDGAPSLVMCAGTNCDLTETCSFFYIPTTFGQCYINSFYYDSAYIYDQANQGLPVGVYIAQPGCASPLQLPTVNTCYNRIINGAVAFNLDYMFKG